MGAARKQLQRSLLFLLLLVFVCTGCGKTNEAEGAYHIYYLNKDNTKITEKSYAPSSDETDTRQMIDEFLSQLASESGDVDYKHAISGEVRVIRYELEGQVLTLYFNNEYNKMDRIEEALSRAAIVRTLTQIDGVDCLTFYVGDAPLADSKGNPVGVMTNDSFIENPGEQINSIQTSTIVLYFANEKGNGLVQETQEVHYSSNISMEKLVMEHLLDGPKSKHAQSAIPEGTKLVNVSVLDGVCYVSLDENFRNQNYSIEESVVIYSIVDSLSEISTINKVQISVNGDTSGKYRDTFSLSDLYVRDLDYVTRIEDTEVELNDVKEEPDTGV